MKSLPELLEWLAHSNIPHRTDCEFALKAGLGGKCTCGQKEVVEYLEWWNE